MTTDDPYADPGRPGQEPGAPVIALCGKVWVPGRDPNRFPVCPTCKEIYQGLRGPQDEG